MIRTHKLSNASRALYQLSHQNVYSGTSLIRSPTGLGKNDLNREVTVLQGAHVLLFAWWNTIRE